MPLQLISSLDDSRLDPYRELKKTNLTRWSGRFIAEGEKVVRRLLESDFQVESVLVAESKMHTICSTLPRRASLLVISEKLAEQLTGFHFHAGVLACGARRNRSPEDFQVAVSAASSLLVACDRVTDPDNLGTIIRLCTAFGIQGLILGRGCADPFTRRTLRVSMGNAFTLPILEVADLREILKSYQDSGYDLLATMLHPSSIPLEQVQRPRKGIVLLGNESHGLDEHWLDLCHQAIAIPMSPGTDSLNVGVATGIFLHYLTRLSQ